MTSTFDRIKLLVRHSVYYRFDATDWGMLILGAIIAREYGLPCITGIPDATTLIQTGDEITVDGFLGIVTIGESRI